MTQQLSFLNPAQGWRFTSLVGEEAKGKPGKGPNSFGKRSHLLEKEDMGGGRLSLSRLRRLPKI